MDQLGKTGFNNSHLCKLGCSLSTSLACCKQDVTMHEMTNLCNLGESSVTKDKKDTFEVRALK